MAVNMISLLTLLTGYLPILVCRYIVIRAFLGTTKKFLKPCLESHMAAYPAKYKITHLYVYMYT